jgi:c-di-GMP-binding flagellar brake protein YcgR
VIYQEPVIQERRRHVRVKPTVDAPAQATMATGEKLREVVDIFDISVAGAGLAAMGKLVHAKVGDRMAMHLSLGAWGEHAIDVVVRWISPTVIGVELVDAPPDTARALQRYVSELLARGAG